MIKFSKAIWQLRDFQKAFNSTCNDEPTKLTDEELKLRNSLFREEFKELVDAGENLVEQADALIDMAYISFGDLVCLGEYSYPCSTYNTPQSSKAAIERLAFLSYVDNIDEMVVGERLYIITNLLSDFGLGSIAGDLFDEVHRSNMSKLDESGRPIINDGVLDPNKPIGKVLKSKSYFPPNLKSIIDGRAE